MYPLPHMTYMLEKEQEEESRTEKLEGVHVSSSSYGVHVSSSSYKKEQEEDSRTEKLEAVR
jgi:hypothetical protein